MFLFSFLALSVMRKTCFVLVLRPLIGLPLTAARVLEADRRVEMPEGCITSSHKSFGQGRAVSVCDTGPDRVYRAICI